jgi:hypothetical protein
MIEANLYNFCNFYLDYIVEGRSDELQPICDNFSDLRVFKIHGETYEEIEYLGEPLFDFFKFLARKLFIDRVNVYLDISKHKWRDFQALDVIYGMGLLISKNERFNPPVIEVGNLVIYTSDDQLFKEMEGFNSSIIKPVIGILENISLTGSQFAYKRLDAIREGLALIVPFLNSELRFTKIEEYDIAMDSGINFKNFCQDRLGFRRLEIMLNNKFTEDESCRIITDTYRAFKSLKVFAEDILNEDGNELFLKYLGHFSYYDVDLVD